MTGGALASSGTVSGTASISYQAADTSSGVRLVQLRVDGEPVAEKDYIASCSYTDFQACPPSVSDTISWNTATVANGQHRVELVVEDAAQNTSVIYSGEVTVQNGAQTASLGALPGPGSTHSTMLGGGSPNGTSASETAQSAARTEAGDHAHLRAPCDRGRRAPARRPGSADRARDPGCSAAGRRGGDAAARDSRQALAPMARSACGCRRDRRG